MKKIALMLGMLVAVVSSAHAQTPASPSQRLYIGGDYEYTTINYERDSSGLRLEDYFGSTFNGGNVHLGARVGRYLGVEGGYFLTARQQEKTTSTKTDTRLQGAYFDVLGYYPLAMGGQLEGVGSVGVGYYRVDTDINVGALSGSASDDITTARFGLGFQYNVTDALNTRVMVHYADADDGIWTYGAGFNFGF